MIYKYCSADVALRTILLDFLKFSPPDQFNDPYDVVPCIKPYDISYFPKLYNTASKLKRLFDKLMEAKIVSSHNDFSEKLRDDGFIRSILQVNNRGVQDWISGFQKQVSGRFAMTCFSKRSDTILMWAHYADNFKGCVLGFDFDTDTNFDRNLRAVQYRKKPVGIDVKYTYGYKMPRSLIDRIMVTKHIGWAYEKEVRLIMTKDNLASFTPDGSSTMYGLANPLSYLKEVIVGQRTSDRLFLKVASEFALGTGIVMKRARIKAAEYQVVEEIVDRTFIQNFLRTIYP